LIYIWPMINEMHRETGILHKQSSVEAYLVFPEMKLIY
jgi:hypothetical protein